MEKGGTIFIVYSGVGPEFAFSNWRDAKEFMENSEESYQIIELRIQ